MGQKSLEDQVLSRLDAIITLLEDLFILQGVKAGINKGEVRKLLSIDKRRVSRISKHFGKNN